MITERDDRVFTPLGRGRIVYTLPDGTVVVEFDHGSGHIFHPSEVFRMRVGGGVIDAIPEDRRIRGENVP